MSKATLNIESDHMSNPKDAEHRAKPFAEAVPSAPAKLKARKQQVVRDALSDAAAALFHARGFEAVTVEEYCADTDKYHLRRVDRGDEHGSDG